MPIAVQQPTGQAVSSTGSKTKDSFLAKVLGPVQEAAKASGIRPSLILGQMAEESGWGTSTLASKYNNYWGIKKGGSWSGPTVRLYDKQEKSYSEYRVYNSIEEGLADHARVLSNSRYSTAMSQPDVYSQVKGIASAGYASNQAYADNVISIIKGNEFTRYDDGGPYIFKGNPSDSSPSGSDTDSGESDSGMGVAWFIRILLYVVLAVIAVYAIFHIIPPDARPGIGGVK